MMVVKIFLKSDTITNIYLKGNQLKTFPFNLIRDGQIDELNLQENLINSDHPKQVNVNRFYI